MIKKSLLFVDTLFSTIALIFIYTLLHEGGHAITAILYGGKIDKFVLGLNAHVVYSGVNNTRYSEILNNVAGAVLPVLFLIVALFVYNSKIKKSFHHILYFSLFTGITYSLLAWVAIPVISLFAHPPVGDDVTKFLNNTKFHPIIVALSAVFIIAALTYFAVKRGLTQKIKEIFHDVRKIPNESGGKKYRISLIIGMVLLAVILLVGLNMSTLKPVLTSSVSMGISSRTKDWIMPFEVKKTKLYKMDFELYASGYIADVQIYNKNGNRIHQNTCSWITMSKSFNLEKGNYVFALIFLKDSISLKEHFKKMNYDFGPDVLSHFNEIYKTNSFNEINPLKFSVTIK